MINNTLFFARDNASLPFREVASNSNPETVYPAQSIFYDRTGDFANDLDINFQIRNPEQSIVLHQERFYRITGDYFASEPQFEISRFTASPHPISEASLTDSIQAEISTEDEGTDRRAANTKFALFISGMVLFLLIAIVGISLSAASGLVGTLNQVGAGLYISSSIALSIMVIGAVIVRCCQRNG